MKYVIDEDYTKELDNVFGIDECKDKIINYVKFLEISKNDKFANYNIIIHTNSDYPAETQIRLLDYICDRLNDNNIINSGYEYLDYSKYTNLKRKECDNFLNEDLIIIDLDRMYTRRSGFVDDVYEILNTFNDKVFILIDTNNKIGMANSTYNTYFDWFFEISKISYNDKKRYIYDLFDENNIDYEENINNLNQFIEQPFYMLKSEINHVLLNLKLNNISKISEDVVSEYFYKDNKESKNKKAEKHGEKTNKLTFNDLVGVENIQNEIEKIVNYIKVCKQRKGNMPSLHMCFMGNPGTRENGNF